MNLAQPSPPGTTVTLTRDFPDAPPVLFEAFTDAEALRQWWCPHGFRTVAIDFRAEAGGRYRVELRADDGMRWVHEGEFLVVNPPAKLVYTWRWTEGPMSRADTLVELSFEPHGRGTRLTVSHSRFGVPEEGAAHRDGWSGALERLDARLTAMRGH